MILNMIKIEHIYLRLHEYQIDEEDNVIMFNIFIRKSLAPRTLRQSDISSSSSLRLSTQLCRGICCDLARV